MTWLQPLNKTIYQQIGTIEGYPLFVISLQYFRDHPEMTNKHLALYSNAYHNVDWAEDLQQDLRGEDGEDWFAFSLFDEKDGLVASRVLRCRPSSCGSYQFHNNTALYLNAEKAMLGDFAVTHPEHRGKGLMGHIITASNKYVFEHLGADYTVARSTHWNALRLYEKLGATFMQEDIDNLSHYLTAEKNRFFFNKFMTDPVFKEWKCDKKIRYYYDLKKLYSTSKEKAS